jgi:hypothetical protein
VSAARGPPSRGQARVAPVTRPPLSGRQVLLFRASARDKLTPPPHRAPPGQHAGSPLAEGTPARRAFVPGAMRPPGFDAIVPPIDASAVVHARSSSRRTPDPLTAGLFLQRSPPRLLTGAACSGLGSPPAMANPEGQTSITGTARLMPATFYIAITPLSGHTAYRRFPVAVAPTSAGRHPDAHQDFKSFCRTLTALSLNGVWHAPPNWGLLAAQLSPVRTNGPGRDPGPGAQ